MALRVLRKMLLERAGVNGNQYHVETMYCQDENGKRCPTCKGHFWLYPYPGVDIAAMEVVCREFSYSKLFHSNAKMKVEEA